MKVLRATFFVLLISMALNWPKAGWTNQTDTRLDSLFSQLQATSSEKTLEDSNDVDMLSVVD